MFAAVRQYSYDPQHAGEINKLVREGIVPSLRRLPGFVAYYWMDTGEGAGAAWIVFESERDAAEPPCGAFEVFQTRLSGLLGKANVTEGRVVAFTNAGL